MIRDGKLTHQACGCLCCAAQFLKVDTLVRHILEEHKDFLMSSMHGKDFSDFDSDFQSNNQSQSANQSLRRHFDCQFCGQKFLRRHKKLFLVHLEQKHLQDLERFMHQSDMLLFNIENVENIEVKLLQNLSAKVRITNSSNSPNHQMQNNNTGKSLSEALIFASTNPQYYNRLFIELQVQYMKIPSSEHGENMLCTEIVFDIQNNFCTQLVLPMFCKKKSF